MIPQEKNYLKLYINICLGMKNCKKEETRVFAHCKAVIITIWETQADQKNQEARPFRDQSDIT